MASTYTVLECQLYPPIECYTVYFHESPPLREKERAQWPLLKGRLIFLQKYADHPTYLYKQTQILALAFRAEVASVQVISGST